MSCWHETHFRRQGLCGTRIGCALPTQEGRCCPTLPYKGTASAQCVENFTAGRSASPKQPPTWILPPAGRWRAPTEHDRLQFLGTVTGYRPGYKIVDKIRHMLH